MAKSRSTIMIGALSSAILGTVAFARQPADGPLSVGIAEICLPSNGGRFVAIKKEYAEAVAKGGNIPVVISRFGSDEQLDSLLSRIDVLLLAGGEDVSPARYGESDHAKLGAVNLDRDAFEFRLLSRAEKRRVPLVGICRGCQVLNVFFGGTLWQDLPSEFPVRTMKHRGTRHSVAILPDSLLAQAFGATNVVVNSSHHQAAKRIAPGFRVVAEALDGVPEAIESADYPAIGVQFHPEVLLSMENDAPSLRFFSNIMQLLKQVAKNRKEGGHGQKK